MARGSLLNNKIVLLATICMMLPLAVARAQTSPDPNISLDSRVYSSDLVIEGRLVEPIKDPAVKDAAVRVTAIYRGAAKVGEKILVVGIGDYQKPSPGAGANVPVGPKDALILFLTRAGVGVKHVAFEGEAYVPNPEPWEDFGAGIRMVLRGDVCDFYERPSFSTRWGGPYPPYVMARNMIWPGPPTTVPEDAVLKYRQRLRESADRAFRWHARLDRPATATDIPWLISLIKERYKPLPPPSGGIDWKVNWYREAVAASAVGRLVELRDFRASIQAIAANPIYVNDFSRVFASPQGRDFLLERLADHSLGIPLRKSIGYLVEAAGLDYSANLPRSPATQPSEEHLALRNGSYLTRIAQIAADASSVGDNEIAIALLRMFAWQFSSSRDVPRGTQLALDLHGAASILRQVCANKKASGEIRFRAAETIYAFGDKEFAAVDLQCGPVLALVSPANEIAASTNAITFSYELRQVHYSEPITKQLILESATGGDSYNLPANVVSLRASGQELDESGQDSFPLPVKLKPGRYLAYYRFFDGTRVVSEGYGCEFDLPSKTQFPTAASAIGTFNWLAPTPSPKPWPRSRKIAIGISPFVIAALLLLRALIRSGIQRRRARKGRCPQCGYDLRFSSGRCTECGRPISAKVSPRLVRRSLARIVLTASVLLTIATAIVWVRSHYVADCWVRTTADRADSVYFSRGAMVLNLFTTVGDPGWSHLRAAPLALPRTMAESGDLPRWNVFGIEYSSLSQMLIVPLWAVFLASTLCGLLMTDRLRRLRGGG